MDKIQIFISYRRKEAIWVARALYTILTNKGYNVFFDIESLHSGPFPEQLYRNIDECSDVLAIMSPGIFDCKKSDEEDFVYNELKYALDHKKKIIPVLMPSFSWNESSIPDGISQIKYLNGIDISGPYLETYIHKLCDEVTAIPSATNENYASKMLENFAEVPNSVNGYIPNEESYSKIKQAFSDGCNPIYITGLGGIGKSQIVKYFAKEYKIEHPELQFYWLTYNISLKQTFVEIPIPNVSVDSDDQNAFLRRLEFLAKLPSNTVIIIDNADEESESSLKDQVYECGLNNMKARFVFTTRTRVRDIANIEIMPLSENNLLKIMRREMPERDDIQDDDLLDIIRLCGSHTLTIEVVAKTLAETIPELDASDILECFNKCTDENLDAIAVYTPAKGKKQDKQYRKLFQYLVEVFSLAALSEEQLKLLCVLSFVPVSGIDTSFFIEMTSDHGQVKEVIRDLINRGWIFHEKKKIKVHPIISEVIRYNRIISWEALKETIVFCRQFLANRKQFDADKSRIILNFWDNILCYNQEIVSFVPDKYLAEINLHCGRCLLNVGNYSGAMNYLLTIRDSKFLTENDQASVYMYLGIACGKLRRPDEALEWHKKGMEYVLTHNIHEMEPEARRNLGISYGKKGMHTFALEQLVAGIDACTETSPSSLLEKGTLLMCCGTSYRELGNIDQALKLHEDALEIKQKILGNNHWDIGGILSEMAQDYMGQNDYEKAIYYFESAYAIRETAYLDGHPALLSILRYLAVCYQKENDLESYEFINSLISKMIQKLEMTSSK